MATSSAIFNRSEYDVFLSFRGEDTRKTFVDHLYDALTRHQVKTFTDDQIERPDDLWNAIEESRIAIVIFSKSYASSSRSLDELAKIMECRKKNEQFVLPVYYYDFNPSILRRHGSVFGELFAKHEMGKVKEWTSVLVEAANLSGIGLIDYRYQANHIKEIVEMVLRKLSIEDLNYNQNAMGKKHGKLADTSHYKLIGIERHLQQVKELLQVETVKTASNPTLASPAPRSSWWTYDVFMCFKADDTCKDFADQLHSTLEHHNIYAFRNDQALARIGSIVSEDLQAIEESYTAVIIFSENYASSSWCLDELVKIMNCKERFGQMVYPIFYNVDPSDVRYQKGTFGEALMRNKPEKVEIWRKALIKVGSLAGWYLKCTPKSDEATVIKSIVDVISRRLDWLSLSVDDSLIGIEAQMKHVMSLLKLNSGSVHMLGICGMGGIGKTTLARAVFDQVSTSFDSACFVENIREVSKYYGLNHIQRVMLSRLLKDENLYVRNNFGLNYKKLVHRKVFLVLDDVDDISQLEAFVGFNKWFGEGSRIIITTRDETLLLMHSIIHTYYVRSLNDDESYQFLRRHAFKKDDSTKAYEDLLPQVISYAAGLPLALKVLSSLLCGRSKKEWTSTLARLQVCPEKAIQDTLKRSYDSLNAAEKEIFLDIACFFNDAKKDYAVNILDSCGLFGDIGIRILEQKSLMSILKGRIKMHRLIEQMGRDIVRQTHPDEPGKRSRVWVAEEVYDMLMDSKSKKEIGAIVVDDMHDYDIDGVDMTEAFRNMKNLRLLQIRSHNKLRCLEGSNYLPKSLCWLTLNYYPQRSLPPSFKGNQLVGLELPGSSISELWHGIKFLFRLCFLDLSYSTKLVKTPDFTGTPNLKELKLEYCIRLVEVHESIGYLDSLILLSFRSCRKLETLPKSFWKLKSLRCLDLSGCLNLKRPKLMDYQLQLLSNSQMIKVPGSIEILSNLVELDLSSFKNLSMPSSLSSLRKLNQQGRFTTHKKFVVIARHSILKAVLSEGKTSQESVEDKKGNISLLPGKKGV